MLLQDDADLIRHLITLEGVKQNLLTLILPRIQRTHRHLFAVQVFVEENDGSLDDVFVPQFACSDVTNASGGARARRTSVGAGKDPHREPVSGVEATVEPIT